MPSAAIAIVDTGPLFAAADERDSAHTASLAVFGRRDLRFVIPVPVAIEAAQLVAKRLGAAAEASFWRALGSQDVEPLSVEDFERIAELVDRYADFPLGGVDASVIALAERLGTPTVLTLDRRHFAAVRPNHCDSLQLLPE
jgi:uncharacterized protein